MTAVTTAQLDGNLAIVCGSDDCSERVGPATGAPDRPMLAGRFGSARAAATAQSTTAQRSSPAAEVKP